MRHLPLDRINDLGLISVLPWPAYLGFALLLASFWRLLLQREANTPLLLVHLLALVGLLHVTLPLIYGVPRFNWTYKHIGVVDYFLHQRQVDPLVDAYNNWPGFFAWVAALPTLFGLPAASLTELARWTPALNNLLYALPLLLLYRTWAAHWRTVWLALLFFSLGNWIGQDYFSPQGFTYFLYLSVLALSTVFLKAIAPRTAARFRYRAPALPSAGRDWSALLGLTGLLILGLCAAIAAGHQLTPFMLLASLVALIVSGQRPLVLIAGLVVVAVLAWDVGMAHTYLSRYAHWYSSLGHLENNLEFNVDKGVQFSAQYTLMKTLTRLTTLFLWLVAAAGVARAYFRHGRQWRKLPWPVMLLAAAPFPMIVLGAYGGEMVMRITLFALPFMAFLAASAFRLGPQPLPAAPPPTQPSPPELKAPEPDAPVTDADRPANPGKGRVAWPEAALGMVVTALMAAGVLVSAYTNESTNRVLPDEVQGSAFLYRHAAAGSAIVTVSIGSFPLKISHRYAEMVHMPLVDDQVDHNVVLDRSNYLQLREQLRDQGIPAGYVVFSRTQQVYVRKYRILAEGAYAELVRLVTHDPTAQLVYRRGTTWIYRIAPAPRLVPE